MNTPRPEADMLHMQHAQVAALLARQQEAARLRVRRDAVAQARPAAEPEAAPVRSTRKIRVQDPRTA